MVWLGREKLRWHSAIGEKCRGGEAHELGFFERFGLSKPFETASESVNFSQIGFLGVRGGV